MTDVSKKNQVKTIIIIVLCIVILAAGVIVWMMWPRLGTEGVRIDPNATTQEKSGSNVAIPGWVSITIPANTTNVKTVDFYNPDENADNYYLTFKVELENTGEIIYESGLIEPGKHIKQVELSREFDKGNYDAIIHVQPYTMDDEKTPVNNADLKTELIVK